MWRALFDNGRLVSSNSGRRVIFDTRGAVCFLRVGLPFSGLAQLRCINICYKQKHIFELFSIFIGETCHRDLVETSKPPMVTAGVPKQGRKNGMALFPEKRVLIVETSEMYTILFTFL